MMAMMMIIIIMESQWQKSCFFWERLLWWWKYNDDKVDEHEEVGEKKVGDMNEAPRGLEIISSLGGRVGPLEN